MTKLVKRTVAPEKQENTTNSQKRKQIAERKQKTDAAVTDNPYLTSVPAHMQDTMTFINNRNADAKNFVSKKESLNLVEQSSSSIEESFEKMSRLKNL